MVTRSVQQLIDRFPLFILFYFTLQVLVRMMTTPGAVIDESEQLLLTQYLALGYNAQPPLYTWMQMFFFTVFGPSVFALALLKNLLLGLVYLFTYLTGCRLAENRQVAVLGTLSLLLLPQIVGEAQVDQIHSVLVTTAAAATLYFLICLLQGGPSRYFILIGASVGCGMLAKYNFILVPLALAASACLTAPYRKAVLRPQLLLAIVTAAALVAPHAVWFLNNRELATAETLERMQFDQTATYLANVALGTTDLIVATIAFIGPFLAVYLFVYRTAQPRRITAPVRLLAIFISLSLLLIIAVILITETTQIKQRWLQPFLFVFPLLLFLAKPPDEPLRQRSALFAACTVCVAIVVTIMIPLRIFLVDLTDGPRRDNYPFRKLAEVIADNGFTEGTIVAEDKFIGGNMRLFFPDSTVITPSLPLQPYQMAKQILVVWQQGDPTAILGRDALKPYLCRPFLTELPFRHSELYSYQARYRICRLPDQPPVAPGQSEVPAPDTAR